MKNSNEKSHRRRQARVYAFKFLYGLNYDRFEELKRYLAIEEQWSSILKRELESFNLLLSRDEIPDQVTQADVHDFALTLIYGVLSRVDELKGRIGEVSRGWSLERISSVDLTILMMGAYELLYVKDVPRRVAINEAVELAKIFSTALSHTFVNGVLDAIVEGPSVSQQSKSQEESSEGSGEDH